MIKPYHLIVGLLIFFGIPKADAATLTYRFNHYLFTINTEQEDWERPQEAWTYQGEPIATPAEFRVDGDTLPPVPEGFAKVQVSGIDPLAIAGTIRAKISSALNREAGTVTIGTKDGKVVFDGVGLPGQSVDVDRTVQMTLDALAENATDIFLPVRVTQPKITVTDLALAAQGIKEVVTVGESDFSKSPPNRIHNIHTGLAKFNGHIIKKGETFSFLDVLGPVNGATGFLRELVIKGDRTVPDYGGGLCQVSSTAYRGVWEYGFPIVDRRNHSYIVSHYYPVGTDATVYTPSPDMKFLNDSPGSLLMQTTTVGINAYFIYYGTKDDRETHVVGPYIWDRTSVPADRVEYTTDLAPGEKKTLQQPVPGMKVLWYRVTEKDGKETVEDVFSSYQAKPFFQQIGVATLPTLDGETSETKGLEAGDVEAPVIPQSVQTPPPRTAPSSSPGRPRPRP